MVTETTTVTAPGPYRVRPYWPARITFYLFGLVIAPFVGAASFTLGWWWLFVPLSVVWVAVVVGAQFTWDIKEPVA